MTCKLMLLMCLAAWMASSEAKVHSITICDAREFRQTIASYCAYQRRDVHALKYRYSVDNTNADVHFVEQDARPSIVYYSPTLKIKRPRELYLHRKCCLKGCSAMDLAGIC